MSNEIKDLNNYHHTSSYNHYKINNQTNINLSYGSNTSTYNANMISSSSQVGFDLPSKNLSPQEAAFELGFELSASSSEFFSPTIDEDNGLINAYNYNSSHKSHDDQVVGGVCATIKSEIRGATSASSSEADHHLGQDSGKIRKTREVGDGREEDDQRSQKVVKTKKKEEKKREPRVSFMTKTEVDHLEDGYRWRKYGQKAVKNSPYPRSYYRCTTQKCNVKKRVERSYQDPTVVITTYESQHNHPIPINRRRAMFSGTTASDYYQSSSHLFSDLIVNTPRTFSNDDHFRVPYATVNMNPNYATVNMNPNYHHQEQEFHHQESEFELLKEMFPSAFFKQEQ